MLRLLLAKAGLTPRPSRREREELYQREAELEHALEMAIALSASYARLLNAYDGGQRRWFENAQAWLAWIREHEA